MGVLLTLPEPPRKQPAVDLHTPPAFETPSEEYAAKLRAFLDRKAPYEHPLRFRQHSTWRKADLYLQSLQWIRPSFNLDPTRTPHWSMIEFKENDPDAYPTPTYNEMVSAHRNEAARLGRPEYKPYVRPAGIKPDAKTKAAAQFSAEILLAELERMNWSEQAELGYDHMPRYGGYGLWSWWDVSYDDTTRVPVLAAHKCPAEGCDFKVADPKLDMMGAATVNAFKPGRVETTTYEEKGEDKSSHALKFCLTCEDHEEEQEVTVDEPALDPLTGGPMLDEMGAPVTMPTTTTQKVRLPGPPALEPYTPVDTELSELDSFGKELGQDVPLGQWCAETTSPYDIFWANLGVDEDPQRWSEVMRVKVRSLDWIRSRFPDKADAVKAEDREALLKWHPIAGERDIFFSSASSEGLFKASCRVKEYHKRPYPEFDSKTGKWKTNKGRSIMMAGNVVLLDGPFMIESKNNPGTFIERVHCDYAPFDIRSGGRELCGVSLAEYMFDAQDAINEAKSQTQDTRQRMASPKWLVPRTLNLDYAAVGSAGAHWVYDPPTDGTTDKPEEVGSTTISEGVAREIERDLEYIARVGNTREVETGGVPPGVTAASAIQIMAEQAGEQRRNRIRRIREMYKRVWKHGLQLLHEFVREPRLYHKKDDANEWTQKAWTGLDLMGQCDVQIEAEPEHDSPLQKRENMVTAVNLKVLDTTGKKAQMLVAKGLGVQADLYEDDDIQYESAEREFIDFFEENSEPVVDDGLDDDTAHADQHGQDCRSEKWRSLEVQAGWKEILKLVTGWDQPLGPVDPMTGQAQTMMSALEAKPATDPMTGQSQMTGELDPMTGQPVPVTLGSQWPALLELRILECWKHLAQTYIQSNPDKLEAITKVMRFRAHKAAHDMRIEEKAAAAQAGAQIAAAPSSDATAMGTMPTSQGQTVQ